MTTGGKEYDVIVVGGGPAGMMMAGRAAELGAEVLLLEKNKHLGKKLSITGGGRCNITNALFDTKAFLENFPQAKEFLYSPFSKFTVQDAFSFFEGLGLPLVVEARKRAFPETQRAEDVTKTMADYVQNNGVKVKLKSKVKKILVEEGRVVGVETLKGTIRAKHVALATGGVAAPKTGSYGEGFRFLRELGHSVHEPSPDIVPLTTDTEWIHRLSGVRLSFMKLSFVQKGKVELSKVGKILFTHFGISGPLVLNMARDVQKLLRKGPVTAQVDLFPDTSFPDLEKRILKLFDKHKNKLLKNVFGELIPQSLSDVLLNLPEVNLGGTKIHSISKEGRKQLVHMLKGLEFPITGTMDMDWAVIADGGVVPEEVDFKTMTSRLYPNLYLLGDVLHINRPTGGFSLQLCWTTGWVAGSDCGGEV